MSDQTLLFVVGPLAAGKMTVGQEIARRTGLRLFHNHMAIEPVLRLFDFGTEPFGRLVRNFRQQVFEEVAASDLPGLIFTYAWAYDLPGDEEALSLYAEPFRARGAAVRYLELSASQEVRIERNRGATRLAEKPSKRDLAWSDRHLLTMDEQHQFSSEGRFDDQPGYLRVDNTALSPEAVAGRAIAHFGLSAVAR
ncbi:AAA family ATPase [Longispora albida]|uniref:AAA family ATPase n=1 Tax=Longispora albida TaxID=203523 RepID=UPI00037BDD64|nr:AAA family ATPase [Longispora albida]